MKGKDFVASEWYKKAKDPKNQEQLNGNYHKWKKRVSNIGIIDKAAQLWNYFCSNKTSPMDKILVTAALIYIISPLDLIPDVIPVVGWLDDLGVAGFALRHLNNKLTELALEEEIEGTSEHIQNDIGTIEGQSSFEISKYNIETDYKLSSVENIAMALNADTVIEVINDIKKSHFDFSSNLIFVGRYDTGKTTLINALLGKEWLATSKVPTTKTLTYVFRGHQNAAYIEDVGGSISEYRDLNFLKNHKAEELKNANKIALQVNTMGCLPNNVRIIDTPGLEDPDINISEIAYEIVPNADAVIFVLDYLYAASEKNLQFLRALMTEDKHRKLFVVVNKVDEISESDLNSKKNEIQKMFDMAGVPNANIFPLSAKMAINNPELPEFQKFKNSLLEFISNEHLAERKRLIELKENGVLNNIEVMCNNSIQFAEAKNANMKIDKEKIQKNKKEIKKIFDRKKEKVSRKIQSCQIKFQKSFEDFLSSLNVKIDSQIDAASLTELKNSEMIAELVKAQIKEFIEREKTAIQNELQTEIGMISERLNIELGNTYIPLNGSAPPNWLQENKEIIVPAVIVCSFPFMGLLSWVSIAILGMLGRAPIEALMEAVGVKFGISKIREQLKTEIGDIIPKLKDQFLEQIETIFGEIASEYDTQVEKEKNNFIETNFIEKEIDFSEIETYNEYLSEIKKIKDGKEA